MDLGIYPGDLLEHRVTGSLSSVTNVCEAGVMVAREDLPGETLLPFDLVVEALRLDVYEIA